MDDESWQSHNKYNKKSLCCIADEVKPEPTKRKEVSPMFLGQKDMPEKNEIFS